MLPLADALRDLTARWTEDAARLEAYGATAQAKALQRAADDVLATLATLETDTLTLADAARESGYTADHLGRLVRRGEIENVGRPHAPRIRRSDLPRKASAKLLREHPTHASMDTRRRIARAISHKE